MPTTNTNLIHTGRLQVILFAHAILDKWISIATDPAPDSMSEKKRRAFLLKNLKSTKSFLKKTQQFVRGYRVPPDVFSDFPKRAIEQLEICIIQIDLKEPEGVPARLVKLRAIRDAYLPGLEARLDERYPGWRTAVEDAAAASTIPKCRI